VFIVSQAGISLRGEVNWIVTQLISRRACGAKIVGIRVFGSEAGSVRHAPPKAKVILHLDGRSGHLVVMRTLYLDLQSMVSIYLAT
jgi:hypothetical protein